MQELRERVAALAAQFEAFEKYEHDRWHKLNGDLTPVVQLPERMTREIGKIHGLVDGKMLSMTRDFEKAIKDAVESAVKPLRDDVEKLKLAGQRWTGARMFGMWFISTVLAIVAAIGWGHK